MNEFREFGYSVSLTRLEAHAAQARSAWACAFSSSEEYEGALIAFRRAEGRYAAHLPWQTAMIVVVAVALAGVATLLT
jgi:hypothetical protein